MKKALITGITGQDGSYLAELLLSKGYIVHGIKRRSSSLNTDRIDHIYEDPHLSSKRLFLHYGDLTDELSISTLVKNIEPDEIYNLGAQSHVSVSFETPIYTSEVNALGALKILEAIRANGLAKKCKFYQASTSELYGLVQAVPQKETTPFYPRSPYATAKLFAYWSVINYREAYNIFGCNGILFNHESPRRGETFVTRKITRGLSNVAVGNQKCLYLGNLDAKRDWGHAKDYVEMQWLMLQQEHPDDYVISSGKQYTVRQFVIWAAEELGIMLRFQGNGEDEIGVVESLNGQKWEDIKVGDIIVKVDKNYYRPNEVETLLGDSSLARERLGWETSISVKDMCREMIKNDLQLARRHKIAEKINLG